MSREEDFELVRLMCSRDESKVGPAFETLYRKYRDRIFNTAYRILNDRAHAADVTQDTFLTALRKAKKFRFKSAFSSWLYRIAVNQCLDLKRKQARRKVLSISSERAELEVGDEDRRRRRPNRPEENACAEELKEEVARAVASLHPKLSAVVVMRYVQGLGYEEIAEALQTPLGTVKSRLNRAHSALQAKLGSKLDDLLIGE